MRRREVNLRATTVGSDPSVAPVFLVGCPRSGTTLLQRLLDAHPLIAIAPETHFIRRFWEQRDRYGDLRGDDAFARAVEDLLAIPEAVDMHLDGDAFRAAAAEIDRSFAALFALLLQCFGARRGARVIGEKTPNHLLYMPTLQSFFPGARFIHIVRDPRAVVLSWRTVPWSTGSVGGDARVWRRYIRTARKQPPRWGKLHVVRYESLVTAPELALHRICRFVGVNFDRAMLAFHERGSNAIDFEREPWKRGAAFAVYKSATDEWRERLSREEMGQIEEIVCREMLWLGYRLETIKWPWATVGNRAVRSLVRSWSPK